MKNETTAGDDVIAKARATVGAGSQHCLLTMNLGIHLQTLRSQLAFTAAIGSRWLTILQVVVCCRGDRPWPLAEPSSPAWGQSGQASSRTHCPQILQPSSNMLLALHLVLGASRLPRLRLAVSSTALMHQQTHPFLLSRDSCDSLLVLCHLRLVLDCVAALTGGLRVSSIGVLEAQASSNSRLPYCRRCNGLECSPTAPRARTRVARSGRACTSAPCSPRSTVSAWRLPCGQAWVVACRRV